MLNSNLKPMKKSMLPMNLQLFASSFSSPEFMQQAMQMMNAAGQGEIPPTEIPPTDVPTQPTNATPETQQQQVDPQAQQSQPTNVQAPEVTGQGQAAPQEQQNQLLLGKFKSVEDLANAYANLEQFNTKTRQELSQTSQQMQQLQSVVEQLKQNVTQPPQTEAQTQNNTQTQPMDSEAFMNEFYENPMATLQKYLGNMVKPIIDGQLQPVQQTLEQQQQKVDPLWQAKTDAEKQIEWQNRVQQFASTVPDLQKYQDLMAQIINEDPTLREHPQGLQYAYMMAQGKAKVDPSQVLQDQGFVQNNVLNNPQIKDAIIKQYLEEVKQKNQAPQTIGNNQNNAGIYMSPENRPKSIQDAGMAAMRMMMGN